MSQTMVVVTAEGLGRGDEDLGRRLMIKFVGQLATLGDKPHVVAFYNAGVRLLVRGSPVLDALQSLDRDGVELIACGTCVEHFAIREHLAIGRVSDMREIVASMQASDKVITA
jgi:selenium metabolism protein YedF